MARKSKKSVDVQKFGGTEELGRVKFNGHEHEVASAEAMSQTKLEDDTGEGGAAVIRCFTFGMNLESFKQHKPTTQELFNSHYKGIELALWRDGLRVIPEVNPRVSFDTKNMRYHLFVGAAPMRGHILREVPQTLSQIAHGK